MYYKENIRLYRKYQKYQKVNIKGFTMELSLPN